MKFTNNLGLPQPLVSLIVNDDYTKGDADYSVTELFGPPRMRMLKQEHYDDIVIDVSDRLFALYGKLIHKVLEEAEENELSEERYYVELAGKRISGQVDRFILSGNVLQDYKFVSTYKFKGGVPMDYEQQINSYAYLLRRNGYGVNRAYIIAMLRDWHKGTALKSLPEVYPQKQVIKPRVKLWKMADIEKVLKERIAVHEACKSELPLCSEEDMWRNKTEYHVKKIGGKRAIAKYYTMAEARAHVDTFPGDYFVDKKEFEPKRCQLWCDVAEFCAQYKNMSK
jgi:hypothetical protein